MVGGTGFWSKTAYYRGLRITEARITAYRGLSVVEFLNFRGVITPRQKDSGPFPRLFDKSIVWDQMQDSVNTFERF